MNKEKKIIFLRSLPGGGRSTLVKKILEESEYKYTQIRVHSTDAFFLDENNNYVFDGTRLHYYHQCNLENAINSMVRRIPLVIIDNTNMTFGEMEKYILGALALGYKVEFLEPETEWRYNSDKCHQHNSHGVPLENIQRMQNRWESTELCIYKLELLKEYLYADLKKIKQEN